ncbi:hypothetical protein ACQR3Q_14290 [Dietzia natronolimnaea]|uniref:hypothetical protein n=1 Tax=Dietzia natronolimnaea TaxID=161920 RepID=UPI003D127837
MRIEPLRDRVGDRGGAVLAQGGDELLLLVDQRINLGGFAMQKPNDPNQGFTIRNWHDESAQHLPADAVASTSTDQGGNVVPVSIAVEDKVQVRGEHCIRDSQNANVHRRNHSYTQLGSDARSADWISETGNKQVTWENFFASKFFEGLF